MLSILIMSGFIAILGVEMYIMYNKELKENKEEEK